MHTADKSSTNKPVHLPCVADASLHCTLRFSFLAAMMLAYQPIRSLATINMIAYQGAAAFKRVSSIIDKKIEIHDNKNLPLLFGVNVTIESFIPLLH